MRVLVTGGAGFIGSHIVGDFQGRADMRVLDNLRSGFKSNLAGLKHEFIQASVLEREAVARAMKNVDYVFHLAAMTSVPESMQKPMECNELNTAGTLVVLEEAAARRSEKAGVEQFGGHLRQQSRDAQSRDHAARTEESLRHLQARRGVLLQACSPEKGRVPDRLPALFQRLRPAPGSQEPIRRRRAHLH